MKRSLIFIGTTNLDIVFYTDALPSVGQSLMGTIEEFGGGKGANQAVAAARLGGEPFFATMVGEDDAAEVLIRGLADFGINTSKIKRRQNASSGKSLIFVGSDGSNMIGIDAGANEEFSPDDVCEAFIDIPLDAVVVVEMGLPVDACRAVFKAKGERFLIFNPAPVRAQISDQDCRSIDIITPNETEAEQLTGMPVTNIEEAFLAAHQLRDRGIAAVAITLGKSGVVDTTAAGDAFNGALATAIASGHEISVALRFAVATASLSVTRKGAQQSMPTHDEVHNFLKINGAQNNEYF
jgi:ribokinase